MNVPIPQPCGNSDRHQSTPLFRCAADLRLNPALMEPPAIPVPPLAVAGRVSLLTMGPKGGKSTTAAGLLALGSRLDVPCGLLTLDEALADSLQRLDRFGARLDLLYLAEEFDPEALTDEVARYELQLLVVDHLGSLVERSQEFGANSQGDPVLWARLMSQFTRLARQNDLAIVLLDQSRRNDNTYSGSAQKAGGVDLLCEMQPKDGGLVCTPRGRVPLPPFRVDLDSQGVPVFSKYESDSPTLSRPQNALAEGHRLAMLGILHAAEPGGLKATEWQRLVDQHVGLKKTAFYDAVEALINSGLVANISRRYHITQAGLQHLGGGQAA